ncbi:MAG TPA: adenylate/guanylate cyclase domain-containing protein, partial [Candidatus Limnocylindria bacterium]|nr:adenylate/guanylate cyclase domain-containing protein [Candidatus Limnocylindria bacterium]
MKCPSCSFDNPDRMRFCGACGAALPRPCSRCGTVMPTGFRFCGSCGNAMDASGEAGTSETRQMTVVFADISGFTALAERLDPSELHETMRTAWDAIAAEIRREGGIVEKYIGDAVVAAFGARATEEDHAERAQRAALATLAALERTNARITQRTGSRLALRIGLNTGLASAGAIGDRESEFGVLGDAVNVAARLEQAAEPGEILVGDASYRSTPSLFVYEPHPPIAAKGKSAPVVAWRLVREAVTSAAAPNVPLVGRDAEIAALASGMGSALAGAGRIVSIVGEPGSGKTRLLGEAVALPDGRGARIAAVSCDRTEAHRAYGTIADVLHRLLAIPASAASEHAMRTLSETMPDAEPETRALILAVMGFTSATPSMSVETRRRLIERGVRDLLFQVATSQGLIAAIDDLQFADTASLSLLGTLAPGLAAVPAVLLVSHGPSFVPPWPAASTHVVVRLSGLAEADATALVATVGEVPEPVAREVVARAAGNAAFLVESTRYATESGIVVGGAGRTLADVGRALELPASLSQLLLKRLDTISTDARRILNLAAVLGTEIRLSHLRATSPAGVDLDAALAELANARMLEPGDGGTLRFAHGALREVAYGSTLARHREDLHGRVAQALENTSPEIAAHRPEVLAYHYFSSARAMRAYEHSTRAGERALSLGALEDARHHHQAAAHAAARAPGGGPTERARALLAAADAARALGRSDDALAALEEALTLELSDGALTAELRRRAGRLAAEAGLIERAAEHLADAERRTAAFGRERAE